MTRSELTPLARESPSILRAYASALRTGQLALPVSRIGLLRVAHGTEETVGELLRVSAEGMTAPHLSLLLETAALAAESAASPAAQVQLVWTGPEGDAAHSRDTTVVLSELFSHAHRRVLVSSFVVRQGASVFESLARQMDAMPQLAVQLYLHVPREHRDTRDDSEVVLNFANDFGRQWPWRRRPEIYYDPRSVSSDPAIQAAWHAKCVVVDDDLTFVTSANFTEWAQQRNVEAGLLVRDRALANQLRQQFEGLIATRQVRRLPGW